MGKIKIKPVKKYTNLRQFFEAAISEKLTAYEMTTILDQIEMGIGLDAGDLAIAKRLQRGQRGQR